MVCFCVFEGRGSLLDMTMGVAIRMDGWMGVCPRLQAGRLACCTFESRPHALGETLAAPLQHFVCTLFAIW